MLDREACSEAPEASRSAAVRERGDRQRADVPHERAVVAPRAVALVTAAADAGLDCSPAHDQTCAQPVGAGSGTACPGTLCETRATLLLSHWKKSAKRRPWS